MQQTIVLIAAIASALAVLPVWPYGYYVLLRLLVSAACVVVLATNPDERARYGWVLVVLAVLFNPAFPVHLNRMMWMPINLLTAWFLFGTYQRQTVDESAP